MPDLRTSELDPAASADLGDLLPGSRDLGGGTFGNIQLSLQQLRNLFEAYFDTQYAMPGDIPSSTTDLAEGVNLYHTSGRVNTLIAAQLGVSIQSYNAGLAAIAALTTTAYGRALLELSNAAALTALIDTFTSSAKGLVPSSGGGTINFLRADGSFACPPGKFQPLIRAIGDLVTSGSAFTTGRGSAASNVTLVANRLYKYLIELPAMTVTKLQITVQTLAASSNCRVGLREIVDDGDGTFSFGNLIAESTDLSTATTGTKVFTVSPGVAISGGLYCVELVSDGTPVLYGNTQTHPWFGNQPGTNAPGAGIIGAYRSYTYGALPSSESSLANGSLTAIISGGIPNIFVY